jgi:hypothetical protein
VLQDNHHLRSAVTVSAIVCAIGMTQLGRSGDIPPSPLALISDLTGSAHLEARLPSGRTNTNVIAAVGLKIYPSDRLILKKGEATLIVPREGLIHLNARFGETNWPPNESSLAQDGVKEVWDGVVETAMWILNRRQEIAKGAVGKGAANGDTSVRLVCLDTLPPRRAGDSPSEGVIFWTAPRWAEPSFDLIMEGAKRSGAARFLRLAPKRELDYGRVTLYSSTFLFTNGWPSDVVETLVANPVRGGLPWSNAGRWPHLLPAGLRDLVLSQEKPPRAFDDSPSLSQGLLLEAVKADALALRVYLAYLKSHPDSIEGHLALARLFDAHDAGSPAQWHLERSKPRK